MSHAQAACFIAFAVSGAVVAISVVNPAAGHRLLAPSLTVLAASIVAVIVTRLRS